ncbi:ribonuclease Z [Candidatus Woesearchaeota archaeon CG10_big_fil_rev_8_21_14_0_10_34_8]|nr:MAG: ribonuclease Z [Candidatus Woesearchaeota archaeon CG10_big_fil_rev_8_21_14_0_10_34_8]
MEITFLGTSAMVPTSERNHSALFIKYKNQGLLIDCGEGTQRQFKQFKIPLTKITKIFITHWHGDHTLGLPGLLQTLSASEYSNKENLLEIYGPKGTKKYFDLMIGAFPFDCKLDIKVKEINKGKIIENKDIIIEAFPLEHSVQTIGYKIIEKDRIRIDTKAVKKLGIPEGPLLGKLQENKSITYKGKKISPKNTTYVVKGKKIGIISDTVQCKNCLEIAKDTDLLICEATFMENEKDKAASYKHLTIKQAALIAHTSETKKLVLTHFSQRYKDKSELENEAKDVYDDVVLAFDGMKIKL